MKYVSTRGQAPILGFEDVLLTGLAADGGLYVPETWPVLDHTAIASFAGAAYEAVAGEVMAPFVGDAIPRPELDAIISSAYAEFRHRTVAPLVQTGPDDWLLELFH